MLGPGSVCDGDEAGLQLLGPGLAAAGALLPAQVLPRAAELRRHAGNRGQGAGQPGTEAGSGALRGHKARAN